MKQSKKQKYIENTFLEFLLAYGWAIVLVLTIVSILLYFGKIGTENWRLQKFCGYEPEKCVCEEYEGGFKDVNNKFYNDWQKCINLRLKTQAESDIDDCNNNPKDDEECKCVEYQTTQEEWFNDSYLILNQDLERKYYLVRDTIDTFKEYNINFTEEQLERIYTLMINFQQEAIYNLEQYHKSQKMVEIPTDICLKSRPKTDWEKHPEDYVAGCNENDILQNTTLGLKCVDCGESECDFSKSGGGGLLEPVYRLKNECEKGLKNWIVRFDIDCKSEEYTPLFGTNVTPEELQYWESYNYTCSILKEYKTCD